MKIVDEHGRSMVAEAGMGPDEFVVVSAGVDDHARFGAAAEPFEVQSVVGHKVVEALVGTLLPCFARLAQGRTDLRVADSLQVLLADELRAVARLKVLGRTAIGHRPADHLDHALRANLTGHVDGPVLARGLSDGRQVLDWLAVGAGGKDEVVGPDPVFVLRALR